MKVLIIDGHSLLYRAYYATENQLEYFIKRKIQPTNAIKLMLNMVIRISKRENYTHKLVAFDCSKKTLRHNEFEDYKAKRKAMPQELVSQINFIQTGLNFLGFNICSMEGIEADDIIASYAELSANEKIPVHIYTSDKDMLQLVGNYATVFLPKAGTSDLIEYNFENFAELFHGLYPKQVIDYKAIIGDGSDNLPGIKGIGKIGGLKIIHRFETLENAFKNIHLMTNRERNAFENNIEMGRMCKRLATLDRHLFTDRTIDSIVANKINENALVNFAKFHKIILHDYKSKTEN